VIAQTLRRYMVCAEHKSLSFPASLDQFKGYKLLTY